ncbi:MAG: carbohydrate binding domain-containing protein [Bacteroidota bacterium]
MTGGTVTTTTSTKVLGNYSAQITVTKASANKWYVQLMQNNLPLTAGRKYTVSFWAKASKSLQIDNDVQQSGGNWTVYSTKTFTLTTAWKEYTYTFTAPASVTSQLAFNMAKTTGTIWIDNVSFK